MSEQPESVSELLRELVEAIEHDGFYLNERCLRCLFEAALAGATERAEPPTRDEVLAEVVFMLQGVQTDPINRVDRGNIIDRVNLMRSARDERLPETQVREAQIVAEEAPQRSTVIGASPVCLDCNAAGLRNCSHFDNCDGKWVYKPEPAPGLVCPNCGYPKGNPPSAGN